MMMRKRNSYLITGIRILVLIIKKQQYDSEKAMAPHSSVLAWRIPETEEPGRRPSTGSHRVERN